MSQRLCIPLCECTNEAEVGGKAANLGVLIRNNMPVPQGFAVTHRAFECFCEICRLKESIAAIREKIDFKALTSIRKAADDIAALIRSCDIPQAVWETVLAHARDLGPGQIIVRSSAIGEDSKEASFAGQLESVVALNTENSLREALLRCWASFWSERSLVYQYSRGRCLNGMGMVVQQLIDSRIAGVLFTELPDVRFGSFFHEDRPMLVEYVFGQGEELVSGRQNPGRIVISRASERWEKLSDPETAPREEANFAWVSQLKRYGLASERIMGHPQDIEWTVGPNRSFFLLQTRPLTHFESGKASMRGKVLWSNVNVNENYPDPISPLLYSIALRSYYFYFRNLGRAFGVSEKRLSSMEKDLSAIIGTHGARMYYNLTSIYRVICALPFGKKIAGFFDAFVGVNEPIDPRFKEEKFALAGRTIKEIAEVVRMALVTMWTFILLPLRIRSLEKQVDLHLASAEGRGIGPREDSVMLNRLMGEFDGFLNIRFHHWRKAALADVAAMFSYGLLRSFLRRILGKKQCDAVHHALLKGIPDIVSSEPPQMIWALAQTIQNNVALFELFRNHGAEDIEQKLYTEKEEFSDFKVQLECFLKRWGFRCSGELMLTVPNFREEPAALFELLKRYIEVETESPTQIIQHNEKGRKESLNAIRLQISCPLWILLKCLLAATHKSIAFRERVRMKQAALYAGFRQTVLALGRHLVRTAKIENATDVFFFTYGEIEMYFRGSEIFPQILADLVDVRKKHFERASQLNPPDYLLLFEGEYFDGTQPDFKPGIRSGRVKSEANVFYGVSACGGRIEGKARVLENLWQACQLNAGEILVTRQTDPGWGPVFPLIKGLVMERGGMLSHGAIIAREFGIPAVVGIPKVTQLVSSGQTILVDGDEGYVRL